MTNIVNVIVKATDQTGAGLGSAQAQIQAWAKQATNAAAQTKALADAKKQAAGASQDLASRMGASVANAITFRAVWVLLLNELRQFVTTSLEVAGAWERVNAAMRVSAGGAALAQEEMLFVRATAQQLGLEVLSTTEAFSKFSVATMGTSMAGEGTRQTFLGVMTAASALRLPAEQVSGIIKALGDMASKGSVQMEELKQQLGDRLPGALNHAAKAMGTTKEELIKMIEKGEVAATDFLPKLGKALENVFRGEALKGAESYQGALNSLKNSAGEVQRVFGEQLTPVLTAVINNSGDWSNMIATFSTLGKIISTVGTGLYTMFLGVKEVLLLIVDGVKILAQMLADLGSASLNVARSIASAATLDWDAAAQFGEAAKADAAKAVENYTAAGNKIWDRWAEMSNKIDAVAAAKDGAGAGDPAGGGNLGLERQKRDIAALEAANVEAAARIKTQQEKAQAEVVAANAKRLQEAEKLQDAMDRVAVAGAARELRATQQQLDMQRTLLEVNYDKGKVSLEQYWAERKRLAADGAQAEIDAARVTADTKEAAAAGKRAEYDAAPEAQKGALLPGVLDAQNQANDAIAAINELTQAKVQSILDVEAAEAEAHAKRMAREEELEYRKTTKEDKEQRDTIEEGQRMDFQDAVDGASVGREGSVDAYVEIEQLKADEALRIRLNNIGKMNLAEEESIALSQKAVAAHIKKQGEIEKAAHLQRVKGAANAFGELAGMAQSFGKKGNAAYKAFAIAQATMSTYVAANEAMAQGGGLPWGAVFAAITIAAGLANVAKISGAIGGQAHDGMTNIPREGTYILDGGERVVKSNQNADLTAFLENQGGGGGARGGGDVAINLGGQRLADLVWSMSNDGQLKIATRAVR